MILKNLKIWNFRKFSHDGDNPGLEVNFHKGINALIGENDSGKTAIIDAIKIALLTQSNEYIRITEDDFFCNADGVSETEVKIECIFDDFTEDEAKNFIEWLQFYKNQDGKISYKLKVRYRAWKENNKIYHEFRAGMNEDGSIMDAKARELLKCTYLRPLRDADKEMHSGRNSRISQILYNHPDFKDGDEHEIVEILREANKKIEQYFNKSKSEDDKKVLKGLNTNLKEFIADSSKISASFVTSNMKLKSILESLSLNLSESQPGLGVQNLLFIAAELLLLNHDDNGGLKLALIEEIEAHLHPQAQLRLIDYIQKEYDNSGVQFIISTHSTVLASKINLKNILFCKDGKVFSLAPECTELRKGDYLFLQRFLDSSKANLFFAQGVIMVEGDAENLLIPVLADIIDMPLSKAGVSIVNVGSTAFLRYSNIFKQKSKEPMGIPVSIVTDSDVKPEFKYNKLDVKNSVTADKIAAIKNRFIQGEIKAFVAPHWTLEYTLALSCLKENLYKAILYAYKIQNSDEHTLTEKKIEDVSKQVQKDFQDWEDKKYDKYRIAYEIYNNTLLKKKISKAITAQCLASILQYSILDKKDAKFSEKIMFDIDLYQKNINSNKKTKLKEKLLNDDYFKYLIDAIKHSRGDKIEN